jgi:hypothetical protein
MRKNNYYRVFLTRSILKAEIVLQHRSKNEISLYQFQDNVSLEKLVKWVSTDISPITLNQWWYGDKPTCRAAEDIIPIAIRCELGQIWRRSEEEIEKIKFVKGGWVVPKGS